MRKALFLHIGMGKTGTTALQNFFWVNRRQLRRTGISYPKYGMVAHAHHLLSPYVPPDLRDKWDFMSVAEWAPKLQKVGTDTILLSSELIAWASPEDVLDFCRNVSRVFDLRVVIYLRRQDDMIMANYNQLVKGGSQENELEEVIEKDIAQFDYLRIIEPWATSVGRDNIVVRPYEKQQFYAGDICRDFMYHVFGVDTGSEFSLPQGDPNPRFSPAALEYKRQLNRFIQNPVKSARFNKVLLRYSADSDPSAGQSPGSSSLLSPSERRRILERSRPVNRAIARDYLQRDDGLLFDESIPEGDASWVRPQLTDEAAADITRFIQAHDGRAYRRLVATACKAEDPLRPVQTQAAKFFRACIPGELLARERRRGFRTKKPQNSLAVEDRLLAISVHLPLVTVDGYEALLKRHFGSELVMDYHDRPLSVSGYSRNLDVVRKGLHIARLGVSLKRDTCVHGHFMPLKFLFSGRGHRRLFVTWMSEPVERLVAHYLYWRDSGVPGISGGLHQRMLEENWSLADFCFRPELRNIYNKFLWGFPLARFDFIGITGYGEGELGRFSSRILGYPAPPQPPASETPVGQAALDPALRSRIERYHGADVALYRRALKIREKELARFSQAP